MSVRRTLRVVLLAVVFMLLPGLAYAAVQYPGTSTYSKYPPSANSVSTATVQHPKSNPFGLVTPTHVPPGVNENGVYTTPVTPASKGATAKYNLDWTIGTAGKSGCMVCHGDLNLRRIVAGQAVSMYVSTVVLQKSAHAKLLCTDCHVDFAYKVPHTSSQAGESWRTIAKTSCKNCHQPEYLEWARSGHSTAGNANSTTAVGRPTSSAPGMPRPVCGDCHIGHMVPAKDDAGARAAVHASASTICGSCHKRDSANYDDYYHGAAYKRGAPDAPACWRCHNTHLVLPSADRLSSTNQGNLVATCSQCHKQASTGYVQYAQLIHAHQEVLRQNPIMSVVDTATTAIHGMFESVLSAFGKSGS
jgi:hypothetical protein